jgi:cobalt-zinc-cadmium efflux system membrane fusion protein
MEINRTYLLLIIVGFFLSACSQNKSENKAEINKEINRVVLTTDQVSNAQISTCLIQKQLIPDTVECDGIIESSPNNLAVVSVPMKGFVKRIFVTIGDYVNKGSVLAIFEHPEYVKLQQEYLETKSQYDYYREDFKRQGELSLENATSLKIMQQAQNEFRKTEVRLLALKKQLAFIGIEADSLNIYNIRSEIKLVTPITGYISKIQAQTGMLCTEETPVFQVVGNNNSTLHLLVNENYAISILKEKEVEFSVNNNSRKIYKALTEKAAPSIDENKNLSIYAIIQDGDQNLMPGMSVQAKIFIHIDSVYTLPLNAIFRLNGNSYIFIRSNSTDFEPVKIEVGKSFHDITEITAVTPEMLRKEIVTRGVDFLMTKIISKE